MLPQIKKAIKKMMGHTTLENRINYLHEESLLATGRLLCRENKNTDSIKDLSESEFKVFSQWGDDGIINWIFKQINIENPFFVEFGVQTYQESNTRFLLRNNNWSGLVFDGSKHYINQIKSDPVYWQHSLKAIHSFITKENINQLLEKNCPRKNVELLSIDIDGNDYWIFDQIDSITPKLIICEFNGQFGDTRRVSIPYTPDFVRGNAHYSNLYFGCSIQALISLAKSKGYEFLGTNSNGNNAYFAHTSIADALLSKIETSRIFLPKFRESRNASGELSFLSHPETLKEIKHLNLYNLETNEIESIEKIFNLQDTGR